MQEQKREEVDFQMPQSVIDYSIEVNHIIDKSLMGKLKSRFSHRDVYNGLKWHLRSDPSLSFDIFEGRILNVGLQSSLIFDKNLKCTRELIDPLDNLVVELIKDGIEAYGISPEAKETDDWKEVGLYKGVSQSIPFEDNFFSTILSLDFLDESYSGLYGIEKDEPHFFKKTAEEFRRVLEPNGRCIVTGASIPHKAIEAFSNAGFEVKSIADIENTVIYLS